MVTKQIALDSAFQTPSNDTKTVPSTQPGASQTTTLFHEYPW